MKYRNVILTAVFSLGPIFAASAEATVKLFRIVSPKDEVVIGITPEEMLRLGTGPDLDIFARQLAGSGQMTVWRYTVRKDTSGNLQEVPLGRIAVFKNDTLRIEPYASPLPVMDPDK